MVCECRWSTWFQMPHSNAIAANALKTHSVISDTQPGTLRLGVPTSLVDVLPHWDRLWFPGKNTARTGGCINCKEAKAALAKQAPELVRKSAATCHPAAPKVQWAWPSAEQMALDKCWDHVVRRCVSSRPPPPHAKSKSLSSACHGGA